MKTTLKHQTKTGEIATRTTAREYGYVVVVAGTHASSPAKWRAVADEMQANGDQKRAALDTLRATGTVTMEGRYTYGEGSRWGWGEDELINHMDSDYAQAASYRKNADADEVAIASIDSADHGVLSWHGSRANAEKAANSRIANEVNAIVYIEEINGGVRETVAA